MAQSLIDQNLGLPRNAFKFARAILSALACLALSASMFGPDSSAEFYRITGWTALGVASLIALPFELLDGCRNKRALKEKARTTRLQRVSSGLNDR
jgi:hypothetical protein